MIEDAYFIEVAKEIIESDIYMKMKDYCAHGNISVYEHSLYVAEYAYLYAKKKGLDLDYKSLIRGALLHDFYLYDWHRSGEGHKLHGFRHPFFAYRNAKKHFSINDIEGNIIKAHMFPIVFWCIPRYKETWVVIKADRHCAYYETMKKKELIFEGML